MNHKKTRVYEKSMALLDLAAKVVEQLPPGLGFLGDQLRRAATSVPLNLAEGSTKRSRKERQRYFAIAAGSAREVSAILDAAAKFHGIHEQLRVDGEDMCDHICAMLYKFR